jgi:hypothetical protein
LLFHLNSGGMELLFSSIPSHTVSVPRFYTSSMLSSSPPPSTAPTPTEGTKTDIRFLIWWLREYLLADKNRPELFSQGETMCVYGRRGFSVFEAEELGAKLTFINARRDADVRGS